ncbi:MAG: hypothetical protein RLZZ507_2261 [Cyanobacteriota bacterium]
MIIEQDPVHTETLLSCSLFPVPCSLPLRKIWLTPRYADIHQIGSLYKLKRQEKRSKMLDQLLAIEQGEGTQIKLRNVLKSWVQANKRIIIQKRNNNGKTFIIAAKMPK